MTTTTKPRWLCQCGRMHAGHIERCPACLAWADDCRDILPAVLDGLQRDIDGPHADYWRDAERLGRE